MDWTHEVVDQIDWHWRNQLRPRLDGLSDDEYFWEPVAGCWSVRRRGTGTAPVQAGSGEFTIDFAMPTPEPPPVTTIAWRLSHILVGVLGARIASHFGGEPHDYATYNYPGTAAEALRRLDVLYGQWLDGVRGWDSEAMAEPLRQGRPSSTSACRGPRSCCTSIANSSITARRSRSCAISTPTGRWVRRRRSRRRPSLGRRWSGRSWRPTVRRVTGSWQRNG